PQHRAGAGRAAGTPERAPAGAARPAPGNDLGLGRRDATARPRAPLPGTCAGARPGAAAHRKDAVLHATLCAGRGGDAAPGPRRTGRAGGHPQRGTPMTAYFVTGTDTGVGKTLVSCALLHALARR